MLPLYSTRIEDLGSGDFVKIDCAACHHVALLTPEALRRVGLSAAAKVLDLKGAAPVPGVRKEGAGGGFDQMGVRPTQLLGTEQTASVGVSERALRQALHRASFGGQLEQGGSERSSMSGCAAPFKPANHLGARSARRTRRFLLADPEELPHLRRQIVGGNVAGHAQHTRGPSQGWGSQR